jgi:cellulose synthase/poly-beta-1,6-N-acetylglucosamine synthase-like glycosyltransferase
VIQHAAGLAFWSSLGLILYTYAGYPLLIAALARLRPRPWIQQSWSDLRPPPFSIILAVHNGEALLPAQLIHLLSLDSALVQEVIVVSDGSTDATNGILLAAPDPRLRAFVLPEQAGKSAALARGIAEATGQVLLFIDIRPRVESAALTSLLANFADPTVGCVAGELLIEQQGNDATTSAVSGLYWRYEQWIRNSEAAVDSPVGVYGGFYAVRRDLVTLPPAGLILDDMFQPLAVIRQGYRSVLDRQAIVVDRWPANTTGEFTRKVRTLAGNFQLIAEAPWVLTPANRVLLQLISHKLLRLLVPYCFLLLILTSIGIAPWFAALQLVFWLLALVALFRPIPFLQRIAAPASALLVLNAAAVVGLYTFLFTRGPLWRIWSPTAAPTASDQRR